MKTCSRRQRLFVSHLPQQEQQLPPQQQRLCSQPAVVVAKTRTEGARTTSSGAFLSWWQRLRTKRLQEKTSFFLGCPCPCIHPRDSKIGFEEQSLGFAAAVGQSK